MYKKIFVATVTAMLLSGCNTGKQTENTSTSNNGELLSSNTCGANNIGGAGGRIIKVTNLNSTGDGSLRAALKATGSRIVVFEVGGIIDLKKDDLIINDGKLTIAGETAPSPGITIIRGGVDILASDIIVRHIRVRVGDGADLKAPKWESDGICVSGPKANNVLIEHCSVAWAVDENLSVSGPRVKGGTASNVTIRNCIIAEGLDYSTHPKGPHSMGTLIHDFCRNVALIGNFYAHNCKRNPYIKPNATVFMANNLIYDPVYGAAHFAYPHKEYLTIKDPMLKGELTAVGNVLRLGNFSPTQLSFVKGEGNLFSADNYAYTRKGMLLWDGENGLLWALKDAKVQSVKTPMLWPENFTAIPGKTTEAYVLKNAGARPKDRDSVDLRLINDYHQRKGGVIDSQDEVGGYPEAKPVYRQLELPVKAEYIEKWLEKYRNQVEF